MSQLTSEQVQEWLDAYVAAWRSYDHAAIGALFADDATYAYHPWDEPLRGREAIVASWLADRDALRNGVWLVRCKMKIVGQPASGKSALLQDQIMAALRD